MEGGYEFCFMFSVVLKGEIWLDIGRLSFMISVWLTWDRYEYKKEDKE